MGIDTFKKTTCRLCHGRDLILGASLPSTPPGDAYVQEPASLETQKKIPLDIFFCAQCGNIQLGHVIDRKDWYGHYLSRSAYTIAMPEFFAESQGLLTDHLRPREHAILVESLGRPEEEFWDPLKAQQVREKAGGDSNVTAINVMANVDDLDGFIDGIKRVMGQEGTFTFETGYGLAMLEGHLIDVVHHDHLSYFTLTALERFMNRHALKITDVLRSQSKGGSLRCVVRAANSPQPVSASVHQMLAMEEPLLAQGAKLFDGFNAFIERTKAQLAEVLGKIDREKKTFAAFGASVGSTTLIYTLGLGDKLSCIFDDNPRRSRLFSPGYSIPVYAASEIGQQHPDYIIILAWRFAQAIIQRNTLYQQAGGRFITFMPHVKIGQDS